MTESETQEGLLVRMASHRRQIQLAILVLVAALLLVGLAVQAEAQEITAQSGTSDTGSTATASDTNVKVMVLIYNPVIESQGNRRLTAVKGWNSPDALTTQLIQDLRVASHDNAKYEVVKRVELDQWVPCENGRRYTDELYLQEAAAGKFTLCPGSEQSIMADYKRIIQENDIAGAVNRGEIDEVFMWAYPGAGFWESAMAGDNAFNINGGPIQGVPGKPFILMGLNYERTVDLALHSYGHRTERIMERVYGRWSRFTEGNDWERFTLLHRDVPGRGGLGNVHSAFNGRPPDNPEDETRWGRWARYDYDNQAFASTSADDWYNFPHMTGQRTMKNCTAWGCSQHGYLKWWYHHMPYVAGVKNGVLNNWWAYILDPTFVLNPRLPPVPPSNLTASASGSDRVHLTWQDNSSNENGFWIYTDDNYTPPNPPANATSTNVTGLQPDTRYCFKVEAYNNNGGSGQSTQTCATTPGHVPPPANDNFSSAKPLLGASATVTGTNPGATKEAGEPNHAGKPGGKSVWYRWIPQTNGPVTIDTFGSDFDTLLAVYTGVHVSSLTDEGNNDDVDGGLQSEVRDVRVTAGTTYWIAVDGYNNGSGAESGNITLNLDQNSAADTEDPTVSLTAPAEGVVVSGSNVTLSADAADNVGVERVEFLVGTDVVSTETTAPYSVGWDSTTKADGKATVFAKAFDAAGNSTITAPGREVILDNTYPETTITSGPSGVGNGSTATFGFASSENDSTFRCKRDNEATFTQCSSPKTYSGLSAGEHTFQVKAVGAGGEANDSDSTPASRTWTVGTRDTTAPMVTSTTPANGATLIAPGVNVTATFTEAMDASITDGDPSTINGTTFKLMKEGTTTAIAAVVSYDATAKKAILNPNANLQLGTKYKAVVTTGAQDVAGNRLDQNSSLSGLQQQAWTFTIRN